MEDNNVTTRLTTPPPPPHEPIGCPTPGACSCVPPLPEEIAGLIERMEERIQRGPGHADEDLHLMKASATTLRALAQENERMKAAAVPLCIGPPLIGILAKEGAWQSSTGQCVVAADELHGSDPYECIRELEAERDNLKAEIAIAVKLHEQDAADYNELRDERDFFDNECKEHAATIAACVVERDEWQMRYESEVRLVDSIEAERDAAKAEEIAILAEARDLAVANRNYWQAECDAIQAKTIALLDKLDMIEAHESFRGIWPFLHVHGYEYSGPNWKDEVAAIRALAQPFEKTSGDEAKQI